MPGTGVAATVYRPRHPERTALSRLFERHFDRFLREYDERFEHRHGPLRAVILVADWLASRGLSKIESVS